MKTQAAKKPAVQRRQRFRIEVSFTVRYRVSGRTGIHRAQAIDVSSGGIRIRSKLEIPLDVPLQIEFTLPMEPLAALMPAPPEGPDERAVPVPVPDHMSPFGLLKADAVTRTELPADGMWRLYGLEFRKIQPFMRDELTRYVHLYQLAQLRSRRSEG